MVNTMNLWKGFERKHAPETGRPVIQLTQGDATCYPLYYFIPTFSSDGNRLVYHRAENGEVQMHSLNLSTGESIQLTHGTAQETRWIPWCVSSGSGVLDHRSVLDTTRDRLIYFDGNDVHSVDLNGNDDQLLFTIPEDRMAIGQNCISPDGNWLVYIHHDQETFSQVYPQGTFSQSNRSLSRGTVLAAYHFETGEQRNLVSINSPIHHVIPYGDDSLIFCHPATENGMLLTNLNGGWYSHLRTMDDDGGMVCHYIATRRGIAYEVLSRRDERVLAGLYNPATNNRYELEMPRSFGYTHTGRDPEGRLWFYENSKQGRHDLHVLKAHIPGGEDEWVPLTGNWPTYGTGQKSHFHPQLTPDRTWILMTGGDPTTETNHLFLVDVSDLDDTQGIPPV